MRCTCRSSADNQIGGATPNDGSADSRLVCLPKTLSDFSRVVVTENSVRSEIKGVPISREIMVATTMSSLLVALFVW